MIRLFRTRSAVAVAAVLLLLAPAAVSAHPGHDEMPATQNASLLADVVALGGGAEHFSGAVFRRTLAGSSSEEQALRAALGPAMVERFDAVFTYVVQDGIGTMKRGGTSLPPAAAVDAKILASKLYAAGLHDGAFDVERLFDTLFSPAVHQHAMIAVGRKYGAPGETAYHVVLARLVSDLGKT